MGGIALRGPSGDVIFRKRDHQNEKEGAVNQYVLWGFVVASLVLVSMLIAGSGPSLENIVIIAVTIGLMSFFVVSFIRAQKQRKREDRGEEGDDDVGEG